MVKPQQPELARSGRGEVDPSAVKARHGGPTDTTESPAPVPDDNLPGHHPEAEQDKPDVTPLAAPRGRRGAARPKATPKAKPTATAKAAAPAVEPPRRATFAFAFDVRMALAALPFGVTPFTTGLDIADGELRVRFGPWSLRTPLDNIEGAEVTGPYTWFKVAGPAHLSFKDIGLTFATNANRGVCIRFKEPVAGLVPKGLLKHPALTVTVDRPDDLVAALTPVASAHGQA
ncbi:MAG TPA: hypothetical protein VM938_11020 [Acidimicrobiales bacterium]|nr:hypothetical protein [Acidimicrobiales bacterium]